MQVGCGRISEGWLDAAPLARVVSSVGISVMRKCARARRFDPGKLTVGSWPWTAPQFKRAGIVFSEYVVVAARRAGAMAASTSLPSTAWNWAARRVRTDGTGRLLFPVGSERGPKR
jgi:hypothetical protein